MQSSYDDVDINLLKDLSTTQPSSDDTDVSVSYHINYQPDILTKLIGTVTQHPKSHLNQVFNLKHVQKFIALFPNTCVFYISEVLDKTTNRLIINPSQPFIDAEGICDANRLISTLFTSLQANLKAPSANVNSRQYISDYLYSLDLIAFDVALYIFNAWFNHHIEDPQFQHDFVDVVLTCNDIHTVRFIVNLLSICRLFLIDTVNNTHHNDILEVICNN